MEKIKDIISPGHKKDDDIMYGSGNPDDPIQFPYKGTVSREGSHFSNAPKIEPELPPKPTSTKTPGDVSTTKSTSGGFNNDAATTASVKSGIAGEPQSGSALGGTHRAPQDARDEPASYQAAPFTAIAASDFGSSKPGRSGTQTDPLPTTGDYPESARAPLAGVTSSPESSKIWVPGSQPTAKSGGLTGIPHGTGAGTATGNTHALSRNTAGTQLGSTSHSGHDAAQGTDATSGALAAASAAHHADTSRPDSSRSFPTVTQPSDASHEPISGQNGSSGEPTLRGGATAGMQAGSTRLSPGQTSSPVTSHNTPKSYPAPTTDSMPKSSKLNSGQSLGQTDPGSSSWPHNHGAHGHTFLGDPCESGANGVSSSHSGPHITETANRLDPHVDGGHDTAATTVGITSSHGSSLPSRTAGHDTVSSGRHYGRDATLAGGPDAGGVGSHEARREYPASSATGPAPGTAGPHKSDFLHRADPPVDSDLSKQKDVTPSVAQQTSADPSSDHYQESSRHHVSDDTGITSAGAGLAGTAAYERAKNHGAHGSTPASGYRQPGSNIGVASTTGSAPSWGSAPESATYGTSAAPGTGAPSHTSRGSREDHTGRNEAQGAGLGAGATGLATHEYNESHKPGTVEPSSMPVKQLYTASEQSTGALATSTFAGQPHMTAQTSSHSDHRGPDAALAGTGIGGAGLATQEYSKGPKTSSVGPTSIGAEHPNPATSASAHGEHKVRDAALGGSGVGGPGLAAHEHSKDPKAPSVGAPTQTQPPYASTTGRDRTRVHDEHRDDHRVHNAVLGAGAGAGAAGLAPNEFYDEKEAKRLEKAHEKESKQAEKAHEKEHQKDLKHAEKQHEKEVKKAHDKDVKQYEREAEKEAKKHGKEEKKHEHGGEKKHGLFHKLLHHDKENDKGTKNQHLHDPDTVYPNDPRNKPTHPEGTLHQQHTGDTIDRLGHGRTTHEAYDTTEGQNKLHKDPPAKVLEQRGL